MARPFERGLLGGTFDHFHLGHEKLILSALKQCEVLEIWITSDKIASQKIGGVQSFEERSSFLKEWIKNKVETPVKILPRTYIKKLEDDVGPAEWRTDCDAIICTEETLSACEKINSTRIKSNLNPLNIIIVEHFLTKDGSILSSSSIRNGTYTRVGDKWIDESQITKNLQMPKSSEKSLKKPFGTLYEGPENDTTIAINNMIKDLNLREYSGKIVAVGDVCVSALREVGIIPNVSVIDGMTKRKMLPENLKPNQEGYDKKIQCNNPAGQITSEFISCLVEASKSEKNILVNVKGEEDLAPIILHLALPLNALLIYGQPNQGIVACFSNEKVKSRCKNRLNEFIQN
ncbi:MAG: hypothetical protein CMA27_02715 [Euryarchaeota archaeon]|nr:hypothetical protein [Euryarchaeota archaeon]